MTSNGGLGKEPFTSDVIRGGKTSDAIGYLYPIARSKRSLA
jgi:hypothetical protein